MRIHTGMFLGVTILLTLWVHIWELKSHLEGYINLINGKPWVYGILKL